MEEIRKVEGTNNYKVVSTFSGAGGSCLGFKISGYNVLWANEFIPEAQEVYIANHRTYLDRRDIRKVTPEEILNKIGLEKGELDVLEGSPPCASFSTCGLGSRTWGEEKSYSSTRQRVDDLFFEYARILEGLQPKVFVAENVKGLIQGHGKGYFKLISQRLRECGYKLQVQLLNSVNLGVPQERRRVIFIGVREDLNVDPVFPKPLPYIYTFGDAVKTLREEGKFCKLMKYNTYTYKLWKLTDSRRKAQDFSKAYKEHYKKGHFFTHCKNSFNDPTPTVVATTQSSYHPIEPRTLSINELKRVFSFPDDFILSGTFEEQWERIGRSVPPIMMHHISKTIKEGILDKLK